jgi:hypothetical protein
VANLGPNTKIAGQIDSNIRADRSFRETCPIRGPVGFGGISPLRCDVIQPIGEFPVPALLAAVAPGVPRRDSDESESAC